MGHLSESVCVVAGEFTFMYLFVYRSSRRLHTKLMNVVPCYWTGELGVEDYVGSRTVFCVLCACNCESLATGCLMETTQAVLAALSRTASRWRQRVARSRRWGRGWKEETGQEPPPQAHPSSCSSAQWREFLCLDSSVAPFVDQKRNRFFKWADFLKNFVEGEGAGEAGKQRTVTILKPTSNLWEWPTSCPRCFTLQASSGRRGTVWGNQQHVISFMNIVTNVPTDTEVNRIQDPHT